MLMNLIIFNYLVKENIHSSIRKSTFTDLFDEKDGKKTN